MVARRLPSFAGSQHYRRLGIRTVQEGEDYEAAKKRREIDLALRRDQERNGYLYETVRFAPSLWSLLFCAVSVSFAVSVSWDEVGSFSLCHSTLTTIMSAVVCVCLSRVSFLSRRPHHTGTQGNQQHRPLLLILLHQLRRRLSDPSLLFLHLSFAGAKH